MGWCSVGFAFFGLILGGDIFAGTIANLGMTPLYAAVLVGAAQNVFSKSAKYSLFDPCKEMAYIPLDKETQVSTQPSACSLTDCQCLFFHRRRRHKFA